MPPITSVVAMGDLANVTTIEILTTSVGTILYLCKNNRQLELSQVVERRWVDRVNQKRRPQHAYGAIHLSTLVGFQPCRKSLCRNAAHDSFPLQIPRTPVTDL
jgi:hypothetical protein